MPRKYIPTGRPRGRPRREDAAPKPTDTGRKSVEAMAGFGIPEDDIARVIGVAPHTLRKHYREELDLGHVKANTAVARNLFTIATGQGTGSVTAAIFWLKVRAGWSEYSPPPVPRPPREELLGKKEQADMDALAAADGTDWGHLIH